jgi:adenosylhomocysteine nucleosidase
VRRAWFAALDLEVEGWAREVRILGVGKVNAAVATAASLAAGTVDEAVLVGTAGALRPGLVGVHEVLEVHQHDLDVAAIAALTGQHVAEVHRTVLVPRPGVPTARIVTGDVFVEDEAVRDRLATVADLVDMESFAFATACERAGVPWRIAKCVSDDASVTSRDDWLANVRRAAAELAAWADALEGARG